MCIYLYAGFIIFTFFFNVISLQYLYKCKGNLFRASPHFTLSLHFEIHKIWTFFCFWKIKRLNCKSLTFKFGNSFILFSLLIQINTIKIAEWQVNMITKLLIELEQSQWNYRSFIFKDIRKQEDNKRQRRIAPGQ